MNKKILLTILPLLGLVSCTANEAASFLNMENGLPTIHIRDSEHVTYLMLGMYGSIENYEGISTKGKVADKFYENTVVLKADAGTALPDATQVKTSIKGATFRGWAYYNEDNENVWPDYYTTVQTTNGLALKAIFDGTDAGGSQGGGDVTDVTFTVINFPDWIPNDAAKVFVWAWSTGEGSWYNLTLNYNSTGSGYTNVTGTFTAPSNITGFNMARCPAGTVGFPDWKVTGDNPGRIYNKTEDCAVTSGVTTYSSPAWVEYNPEN